MIQHSHASSIHFVNPPDPAKQDQSHEHVPGTKNSRMHPDPDKDTVLINAENSHIDTLLSSTCPRSNSQFSTIRCDNKTPALQFVYQRKKPQKQYVISSTSQSSLNKTSGVSSAVSRDASAINKNSFPECQLELGGINIVPLAVNTCPILSSRDVKVHGPEVAPKRNIRPPGMNVGSSSKSKLNVSECIENQSESISEKDFCLSFLRSRSLLGNGLVRTSGVGESANEMFCDIACKTCGCSENSKNLLICDGCDAAFHSWCCHPRVNDIPNEEWFCNPCKKKKENLLKEMKLLKLKKITEDEVGNNSVDVSDVVLTYLDIMLLNADTHKSEVRVGKGFQADVPEWSGPNPSDSCYLGEALEIGPSEPERLHNSRSQNSSRVRPIGNWLQCRDVVCGLKKGIDGTVCGKWRRVPLFEVQTDEWDCSSVLPWDPARADCAAPQELETEEVMKQLKFIQMLKPKPTGNHQKVSHPQRRAPKGPSSKNAGNP